MKTKSKKSIKKIGNFFREVAVVVLGVAITLSASVWISNRKEKRDLFMYLNVIKLEMEKNAEYLDREAKYLEDWEKYGYYLRINDKESLHADSIRGWDYPGICSTRNIVFQTSAFEMFKVSGTMRLVENKDLLQSVWHAYLSLEKITMSLSSYYHIKSEECKKNNQLEIAGVPYPIPMYDFYCNYAGFGALEGCKGVSEMLKAIVLKLE